MLVAVIGHHGDLDTATVAATIVMYAVTDVSQLQLHINVQTIYVIK